MGQAINSLQRVLSLEIEQGYQDKAVVGGIRQFTVFWVSKAREQAVDEADKALVEQVAEKTGLTRTDVAAAVDSMLEAIKKSLEAGKNIEIRGFGTFKIKPRKARNARNPRTGEEVPVPDRKIPVFKPSNEFKNLVMNSEANRV